MRSCSNGGLSRFREALTRLKIVDFGTTELKKVLTTLDLTALGVGSTLGVGVYVLAGDVAKNTAGPAVTISFLIAAITSILAGLCYAEFGARVPKAGSAYVYSYVCVGEFVAFLIGWNLILEYLIGSATVTKALFVYIDELANNVMSDYFLEHMPIDGGERLGAYADVCSLGIALVFSVAIALGAKESSLANNIFTLVNLTVVTTVIIAGLWKVDASNWSIPKEEVAPGHGTGGFLPYGVQGLIQGAARCFFGFIGFDCIATASEEAKTPQKSIPISVVLSLFIVFIAYFGVSTVITMMLPYDSPNANAPLPNIFDQVGLREVGYVINVGAICGLLSSLLGAMFPLPRIIYAMASDGLLFRALAIVHPKFQTPLMGTLIAGTIAGILACILNLDILANLMSIGTLLAYSMVAACVLILRYTNESEQKENESKTFTFKQYLSQMFGNTAKYPTDLSASLVTWMVLFYFCIAFIFAGLITGFSEELEEGNAIVITFLCILFVVLIVILVVIFRQPKSSEKLIFAVPLVPFIPLLSILVNVYLMTTLPGRTWEYYAYWMVTGLLIYFLYGLWHSSERHRQRDSIIKKSGDTVDNNSEQNYIHNDIIS